MIKSILHEIKKPHFKIASMSEKSTTFHSTLSSAPTVVSFLTALSNDCEEGSFKTAQEPSQSEGADDLPDLAGMTINVPAPSASNDGDEEGKFLH